MEMMTPDNPLVSIVIPTYNREEKIVRAVNSCLRQSYPHVEIVIVDDGSTDDSHAVLRQLSQREDRVKIILNTTNRGGNYCRNQGFESSSGSLVVFLDSDDEFSEEKVERSVNAFRTDRELDCVVAATRIFDEVTNSEVRRTIQRIVTEKHSNNSILENYVNKRIIWLTHEPVWKRSFLQKCGVFSTQLKNSQEYEFHCRALAHDPKIHVVPECLATGYYHNSTERISGPSRKRSDKIERHFRSKILSRFLVAQNLLEMELFTRSIGVYLLRFSAAIQLRCYRIAPSLGFTMTKFLLRLYANTFGDPQKSLRALRQVLRPRSVISRRL